jgi:hypothetical protein
MRQPTSQITKLIHLLLMAAKTTIGELYIPVPIILLKIKALVANISLARKDTSILTMWKASPADAPWAWMVIHCGLDMRF